MSLMLTKNVDDFEVDGMFDISDMGTPKIREKLYSKIRLIY